MKNHYILMADIIKSREKDSLLIMKDFKEIVAKTKTDYQDRFLSPPTITLGDEFQAIVTSVKAGIEVIFAFEELLVSREKNFKLRYILDFGQIDTAINPLIAYGMLGNGLAEARGLLGKQKSRKERFQFNLKNDGLSEKLDLVFVLFQSIVDGWKSKDCRIVKQFFIHDDYKVVAHRLRKDASLIWKRKKSLHLPEYKAVKELVFLLLKESQCQK